MKINFTVFENKDNTHNCTVWINDKKSHEVEMSFQPYTSIRPKAKEALKAAGIKWNKNTSSIHVRTVNEAVENMQNIDLSHAIIGVGELNGAPFIIGIANQSEYTSNNCFVVYNANPSGRAKMVSTIYTLTKSDWKIIKEGYSKMITTNRLREMIEQDRLITIRDARTQIIALNKECQRKDDIIRKLELKLQKAGLL